jgi:carbamate kinase
MSEVFPPADNSADSVLVALGGNSISPEGEEGNIEQQFRHTEETMRELVRAVRGRFRHIVITHGNGPQIGNILLRSEVASRHVYPLPLDTCVSDSEGGMGYMIQQVLHNVLCYEGDNRSVVSLLTQTVVDPDDPNWNNPTKYVGQFYSREQAQNLMAEHGWRMREDAGRGWRRVVPSPAPLEIIELDAVRALLERGFIVIAAGGGGIPVIRDAHGRLHGVEAVVDKDLASALLASKLGIGTLVILTGVEKVALDYGRESQRSIDMMTRDEAWRLLADGHFPPGNMGPKIRAAAEFASSPARRVIITHPARLCDALDGKTGTVITASAA